MSGWPSVLSSDKPISTLYTQGKCWYFRAKRLIDFCLASVLLIVFAPLMAVIAILIKLDSSGPVFFRQNRVGAQQVLKDGVCQWKIKEFSCIKFRTMVHHADPALHKAYVTALIQNNVKQMDALQKGHQKLHKLEHDPRITRIGHFLRKYSLDELPQFINVLQGQMSLVGPRPALDYEVKLYSDWHKARLYALPGITGLQQVMERCTADFDHQVQYDLDYIRHQSLWLDLKIMAITPFVILRHKGAR